MNNIITAIALSLALLLAPAFVSSAEEVTPNPSSPAKTRMTKAAVAKIATALAKKNGVQLSKYVQSDAKIDTDIPTLTWWVFLSEKKREFHCYVIWVEGANGIARFVPCCRQGVC